MFRVLWENRDNLPYARQILKYGVCDGCTLSTRGLHDDTIEGVHLCLPRLRLLYWLPARYDLQSGEPDYNAEITVRKATAS
jgi:hypothetical protein